MTVDPQPLRIGNRILSVGAWLGENMRRARYRRADLRRLSAVEMVSKASSRGDAFRWLSLDRDLRGRHVALMCHPGSHVTYDVVLPPQARVVSWCTVEPDGTDRQSRSVEFEILVRTGRSTFSARRLVQPPASGLGRRWHRLRLNVPQAGPARIVLTTRAGPGAVEDGSRVLWGNPQIESPRPLADLLSAVRSATSTQRGRALWHRVFSGNGDRLYQLWTRETDPSPSALQAQREWSRGCPRLFSLITFVAEPRTWRGESTAASIIGQSYPGWEWIVIGREASMAEVRKRAASFAGDDRIRFLALPSERADESNIAIRDSRGEFAALLGHHDTLAPSALYEMARALERLPDADVLYSDEDRRDAGSVRRQDPQFKPDWSPDLLLSRNYIGRLAMIRVAAAIGAGGFRGGLDDVDEWELWLRLSRDSVRVQRVPKCLYHRDGAPARPSTQDQSSATVREHFEKLGRTVSLTDSACAPRMIWDVQGLPTVSIIVPNRNAASVLKQCVQGLLEKTSYPRCEIVIVDNGSTDPEVLDYYRSLASDGSCRIVPFDRPFNFSAACNAGAAAAGGELLLFLNNDMEVIEPDWLAELVRWAQVPEVGVVGAKLLYPDRVIQHAGVVFGLGLVGHIFSRAPEGTSGLFGNTECYRNYLAVTGACQMMRKDVFRQLGGYDERFRLSFSDVVLCMEAWKAGYRVVYTPYARLVHHESYTRDREDTQEDIELLARYLDENGFVEDPFFHPELNPKSPTPALRPPFDPTPRQVIRDRVEGVLSASQVFVKR